MPESANGALPNNYLIGLYPIFLLPDLLDDDTFRMENFPDVHPSVSIENGSYKFKRNTFFEAIRALEIRGKHKSTICDENGAEWEMAYDNTMDELTIILTNDDLKLFLEPYPGLFKKPSERLKFFELALKKAGLPSYAMPEIRTKLEERQLNDNEVRAFEITISRTPLSNIEKLGYELKGKTGNIPTLVPENVDYYERLCGDGQPNSVKALATTDIPKFTKRLIDWDEIDGSKMALLLSSHPEIVAHNGLLQLDKDQLVALSKWAVTKGDLFSLVGMFEVGLQALPEAPELEPILFDMVQAIISQNDSDTGSRVYLLSSLFCLCLSEISRTKVLEDWPPFRRRFAALTQASLLERQVFQEIDTSHFSNWALKYGASRYYMQSLCDLRIEPRWLPDYGSAEQLKYELLGRMHNASTRHASNIPEGDLKSLLTGSEPSSLVKQINLPRSFWPGPLEGAISFSDEDPPKHLIELIDATLDTERLNEKSLVALINLGHHIKIDQSKLDKAIAIIRNANHRFENAVEENARQQLIHGIASLAAATRSIELAKDVQMILRKIRVDEAAPISMRDELIIGLIASAAHEQIQDWSKFIGDWAFDLSFRVNDTVEAQQLIHDLELLASVDPWLRKSFGSAISAIGAFLAI